MIRGFAEWKHLVLLAALVIAATVESLAFNWTESARIIGSVVVLVINVPVFFVVFEERWERRLALFLLASIFTANIVHEMASDRLQIGAIVYHGFVTVFLAFAVAVILKRIFQRQAIRTDDVIGALYGYLLAAIAWGNTDALVYLLWHE